MYIKLHMDLWLIRPCTLRNAIDESRSIALAVGRGLGTGNHDFFGPQKFLITRLTARCHFTGWSIWLNGSLTPFVRGFTINLKGQCHEIFYFWFFSWISFHQALEGRFEFFRKFAEIFAAKGWPPVSTTPAAKLPPVSTTPVANLPPVSTTPAANFATSFSSVVDTGCWYNEINIRLRIP